MQPVVAEDQQASGETEPEAAPAGGPTTDGESAVPQETSADQQPLSDEPAPTDAPA